MREQLVDPRRIGPSEYRFHGGPEPYFSKSPEQDKAGTGWTGRMPAPILPPSFVADALAGTKKKHCESARSMLLLEEATRTARASLARDIHDEAGQHLVAAQFQLAALQQRVSDQAVCEMLKAVRGTLDRLGRELSQIAREASPRIETDLAARIRDLTDQWQRCVGIPVRVSLDIPPVLRRNPHIAETLFRVVQEALTNIAKHARGATAVHIVLRQCGSELKLIVADDGQGLASQPPGRKGGSGLSGMRRRMEEIGGSLHIASRPGKGTRIVSVFPGCRIAAEQG